MFVKRSTMEAAVEAERQRGSRAVMQLAQSYGDALHRVTALQQQLSAWVMNEPGDITPRQMAAMFYAQNDDWQAEFFNVMQEVVTAHHDALPAGDMAKSPGHPAGEGQWWHVAGKLNDSGFETLGAMFEHAQYQRNSAAAA